MVQLSRGGTIRVKTENLQQNSNHGWHLSMVRTPLVEIFYPVTALHIQKRYILIWSKGNKTYRENTHNREILTLTY
jgi:hypothetical protein